MAEVRVKLYVPDGNFCYNYNKIKKCHWLLEERRHPKCLLFCIFLDNDKSQVKKHSICKQAEIEWERRKKLEWSLKK